MGWVNRKANSFDTKEEKEIKFFEKHQTEFQWFFVNVSSNVKVVVIKKGGKENKK